MSATASLDNSKNKEFHCYVEYWTSKRICYVEAKNLKEGDRVVFDKTEFLLTAVEISAFGEKGINATIFANGHSVTIPGYKKIKKVIE